MSKHIGIWLNSRRLYSLPSDTDGMVEWLAFGGRIESLDYHHTLVIL